MNKFLMHCALCICMFFLFASTAAAQRQMEKLGRGVVAINQGDGKVFVSWRMFGTDPDSIAFNLYRATATGEPTRLNPQPITGATCYEDSGVDLTKDNSYFVRAIINGQEQEPSKSFLSKIAANAPARPYFSIPLKTPQGYTPNDASVGDLDGDGEYEIVLHQTGRSQDNAYAGFTDEPILQAYKMDGTLMWSINLGKNIREGAHYTQFMVYDLDGDGKAEIVCKTADGTTDALGTVIGDAKADWRSPEGTFVRVPDGDGSKGHVMRPEGLSHETTGLIMNGPEYLTVFDGATGKALATTNYIPSRGKSQDWGDAYENRADRFIACVAYLDGVHPSVVMCRGYYTRAVLVAWDWRDGKLTHRWTFDSDDGTPGNDKYRGQGNHGISVADVDGDGKDEILYGSCCIDDNGKGLWSTGLGHGDAMHVSDLDPDRPGLEIFGIHEKPKHAYGAEMHDARTGQIIWGKPGGTEPAPDIGRGVAFDIDPRYPGYECWCSGGGPMAALWSAKGEVISQTKPQSMNFGIWWDGDLLRELLDGNHIDKWDWIQSKTNRILTAQNCMSDNGTKSNPTISGDLFGDWREEVVWRTADNQELRIYSTTIPTQHRLYTLMHDPQYRLAIAWQNVAYNQPPHPSFFLGEGMKPAPKPNITTERVK